MSTLIACDASHKPRRRRKHLRLSVWVLMLLVLISGGGMGWVAHRIRVRRAAIAAIVKSGGWVGFNGQETSSVVWSDPPHIPKWLLVFVDPDALDTVTGIEVWEKGLDDTLMAHIAQLNDVRRLSVYHPTHPIGLTSFGMSQLRYLTNLEHLSFWVPSGGPSVLPFLGGQTRLAYVDVAGSEATDDDMVRIGGLTQLESLDLEGRHVTDRGFLRVSNLVKLTHLRLKECVLTDLSPLGELKNLKEVVLGDTSESAPSAYLEPVSLEPLRNKLLLAELSLGNIPTDDKSLKAISALPALRTLGVGGPAITVAGLAALSAAPELTRLRLLQSNVQDLRALGPALAMLRQLDLSGSRITDHGLAPLADAHLLDVLVLSRTRITDNGLVHLGAVSQLQCLSLADTRIGDAGLAHLGSLGSLVLLDLAGTQVTGRGLAELGTTKTLSALYLDRTALTNDGLAAVANLRAITQLDVSNTCIRDDALLPLATLARLHTLDLRGTQIGDAGLARLPLSLSHLSLSDHVTDAGLIYIDDMMSLTNLLTYGAPISEAGIARLKSVRPDLDIRRTPIPYKPWQYERIGF
jgi:internalin A